MLLDRVVAKLADDDNRASAAFGDGHSTFGAVCAAELRRGLPGSILTPVPLRLVLDRRPLITSGSRMISRAS